MLVNNAGYGYFAAIEEGEEDEIRAMFDTNVFGLAAVTRAVLPTMRAQKSGAIVNIDATVICEQPRLGPYKAAMERAIGDATSARVSIKATSNEGMGWIGRGEGIACIAVATVQSE